MQFSSLNTHQSREAGAVQFTNRGATVIIAAVAAMASKY
jgi:hypothetical protein